MSEDKFLDLLRKEFAASVEHYERSLRDLESMHEMHINQLKELHALEIKNLKVQTRAIFESRLAESLKCELREVMKDKKANGGTTPWSDKHFSETM